MNGQLPEFSAPARWFRLRWRLAHALIPVGPSASVESLPIGAARQFLSSRLDETSASFRCLSLMHRGLMLIERGVFAKLMIL
jgi:hypothetical protein